jgi:hypothetical protein
MKARIGKRAPKPGKIFPSLASGILVGTLSAAIHWFIIPHSLLTRALLGDVVGALSMVIVCLAMQMWQEDMHFANAMSCVTIVSELNHRVRSACFTLSLAAQKLNDKETSQIAKEALDRVNIALEQAEADAISGRAWNPREDSTGKG